MGSVAVPTDDRLRVYGAYKERAARTIAFDHSPLTQLSTRSISHPTFLRSPFAHLVSEADFDLSPTAMFDLRFTAVIRTTSEIWGILHSNATAIRMM